MKKFPISARCATEPRCYSSVLPRSLAKNNRPFKKNTHTKRLKKFFCITTIFAHMLLTQLSNFRRNEASELFHTFHIAQTLPYATPGYSQKLKKSYVGRGLSRISVWLKLWRCNVKPGTPLSTHRSASHSTKLPQRACVDSTNDLRHILQTCELCGPDLLVVGPL